jgi:membrane protein YdbS with pleckstrin-like domain
MTTDRDHPRRRGGLGRIIGILLVVWLIIGAIAAGQRHYYTSRKQNCASMSTLAVTIIAGPLNYLGVNPKTTCPKVKVPQPSK